MYRLGVISSGILLIASLVSTCADDRSGEGIKYLPWSSKEYKAKVKNWKYSPDDAYVLCLKHDAAESRDRARHTRHILIADDFYLFSANSSKTKCIVNLQGYYVNGQTGEIAYRGEGELSEEQQVGLWGKKQCDNYPLKKRK